MSTTPIGQPDELRMGANIALPATSLRATLAWTPGPGVPAVDASALLLDDSGLVGGEADFVFYNQPRHPSGAVELLGSSPGRVALDVDLTLVAPTVERIVLAASADGGPFGQVPGLRLGLSERVGGSVLATFAMTPDSETALVCAEIYRHAGVWKFRAIGQGYASGLAGLATDFGIDIAGDAAAAPPPVSSASLTPTSVTPATIPPPLPTTAASPSAPVTDRDPGYDPLLDLG